MSAAEIRGARLPLVGMLLGPTRRMHNNAAKGYEPAPPEVQQQHRITENDIQPKTVRKRM